MKWAIKGILRNRTVQTEKFGLRRTQALVAICIILLSANPGMIQAATLVNDFVAGWSFNETGGGSFRDVGPNGHHLTAIGNPFGDGNNGIMGGAMSLNGTLDAASNPDIAAWGVNQSFSISFWLKLDTDPRPSDTFLSIVGRREVGTANGNMGWDIRNAGPGDRGRIWVSFYGNDGSGNSQARSLQTTQEFLVGTDWVHIVLAASAGQTVVGNKDLYINGVLVTGTSVGAWNNAANINQIAVNEPFAVGKRLSTEAGHVAGQIDEMGLWSRKLTADEVAQLWNNGNGMSMKSLFPIPEPTTMALLSMALIGIYFLRGKRRGIAI